jgi:hypothetical protein
VLAGVGSNASWVKPVTFAEVVVRAAGFAG